MDQKIVGRIVKEMFEKAKKGSASHTKYALSSYISKEINEVFGYRTPERAYEKYIEGKKRSNPNGDSVDLFCKYLGYEDYKEYVEKNSNITTEPKPPIRLYIKIFVGVSVSIVLLMFIGSLVKKDGTKINNSSKCMAWVNDHYEEISCDLNFHPKSGEKIKPYDPKLVTNFKKIEVTILTKFFSEETREPLIWYYKNKKGEIEYFTASGLHPTTGKTLDEITPYIIEKYVPKHIYKPNSFISNDEKN